MDESCLSHTRWKCQYHIVFIPKYRRKVLYGQVKHDVREIVRTLCKYKKVEIIAGAVCEDHVHLCLSIPPKYRVSEFMGYLKGKSALMVYDRHPELGNKFERDFWARGYYVSTVGNVDEETVNRGSDAEQAVIHENSHPIEDCVIRTVQVQDVQIFRVQRVPVCKPVAQ